MGLSKNVFNTDSGVSFKRGSTVARMYSCNHVPRPVPFSRRLYSLRIRNSGILKITSFQHTHDINCAGGEVSPEVSLESSSTYIAAIDVANSSYFGEWELNVSSSGSFSTQMAAAASNLNFRYTLLQPDRSSVIGFSGAVGNPVAGMSSTVAG